MRSIWLALAAIVLLPGAAFATLLHEDDGDGVSIGVVRKNLSSLASNTIYAAGLTTYSSGTYSAAAGPQPIPSTLAAGQVYTVRFNQANPTSANLRVASLPPKPLKVLDALGNALTLIGGEIVTGPATVYYDGTQFIYSVPVSASKAVVSAASASQADFTGHTTFYLPSADEIITLPCSNTISPNGAIFVAAVAGSATVTKGSGCSDTVTKNGSSGTSTTIATGDPVAVVLTDGTGHYYVSGR